MNKALLTALLTLTFTASAALAATTGHTGPAPMQVYATEDSGQEYPTLYTESSWLALEVPLGLLGGAVPADLALDVTGLTAGTSITLDSVTVRGDLALLHVTVARSDTMVAVNDLATIALTSGGQTLGTVSIPVLGAAADSGGYSW